MNPAAAAGGAAYSIDGCAGRSTNTQERLTPRPKVAGALPCLEAPQALLEPSIEEHLTPAPRSRLRDARSLMDRVHVALQSTDF